MPHRRFDAYLLAITIPSTFLAMLVGALSGAWRAETWTTIRNIRPG